MILDALLQGELGDLGIGKIDLGHGRWRRWRRIVEQAFEHPDAAFQRMRILAIGIHGQQTGLGQQAASPVLRLELHAAEVVATDVTEPVVPGESLVGPRVIRMDEVQHAVIVLQDLVKEGDGFFLHRFLQGRVELTERFAVDLQEIQQLHAQPLADKVF